jgi:hypothetical protein
MVSREEGEEGEGSEVHSKAATRNLRIGLNQSKSDQIRPNQTCVANLKMKNRQKLPSLAASDITFS